MEQTVKLFEKTNNLLSAYSCTYTFQVYIDYKEWLRTKLLHDDTYALLSEPKYNWHTEELTVNNQLMLRYTTLRTIIPTWDMPDYTKHVICC